MIRFIYADGIFTEVPEGLPSPGAPSIGPGRAAVREPERRVIERRAVRAVAFRGDKLLMIHARGPGDYKFPGGGVEPGESAIEALGRELREETGHELAVPGALALRVEERRPAKESGAVFHMISDYYLCEVADGPAGRQSLDAYEEQLGFAAAWVSPAEALAANEALAAAGDASPWIRREIFALRRLCGLDPAQATEAGAAPAAAAIFAKARP
jgi:8-oxo-dGTP pyrophosphatase MutT (NUDIX family)